MLKSLSGVEIQIFSDDEPPMAFGIDGSGPYFFSEGCPNCHTDEGWAGVFASAQPCSRACELQLEYAEAIEQGATPSPTDRDVNRAPEQAS